MSCNKLSPCEIACMASVLTDTFDKTATIQTYTEVDDSVGGFADVYVSGPSYPCRLIPPKAGRETISGEGVRSVSTWQILLPLSAIVEPKNRITSGGFVWEVNDTDQGRSDATHITVTAMRVRS